MKRRGCLWYVGLATVVVVAIVVALILVAILRRTTISAADRSKVVDAVTKASHGKVVRTDCVGESGSTACLVTVQLAGANKCQTWAVFVEDRHRLTVPTQTLAVDC